MMKKMLLAVLLGAMCSSLDIVAQDAKAVIDAASSAMGATSLQSVQYSGTGSVFMFGQAFRPDTPWPQFKVVKDETAVNYNAPALREELVRTEVGGQARGGGAGGFNPTTGQGGMRPLLGEQTQIRQATARTDAGFLDIWMTAHGFLRAAAANNATAKTATSGGKKVTTVSFTARDKYTVTGTINDQNLVERVETLVDNNVLGDMPVEITYSDYKDFAGVKFPTRIVRREGGQPTLDLTVSSVQPNGAATLEVRENAPPATSPAVRVETQKIGEGVWGLTAGGYTSVLVEFNDYLAVVEAPGNDQRSNAVIAEVRSVVPNKPIRYLVNTHAHFDHSGGARAFAAEGITIVTHDMNKPYFEKVYRNPHRINPDSLARSNRSAVIEGMGDKRVLTDGTQTLELYHIRGNLHNDGLLMAYLPKEKAIIQADAFHPRPGAPPYPSPPQFTVNLVENVQRLRLDVAQVLHIHGGVDPYATVLKAAGRQTSTQ